MNVVWTGRFQGPLGHKPLPKNGATEARHDESCCGEEVENRRAAVFSGPWVYLTQVHGSDVIVVDDPQAQAGAVADGAVTGLRDIALVIATADCAPIALSGIDSSGAEAFIGAVHAGWKGLQAGVVEEAVLQMQKLGAQKVTARLGPCIHSECYEFGEEGLQKFVDLWGSGVRGTTPAGASSFNLPAAVGIVCERIGVELLDVAAACTACSGEHFSYRAQQTPDRQVMVVSR